MTVGFHHTGVVGKADVVGLPVGGLEQPDVEGLGRLHQSVLAARHGGGALWRQMTDGLHDGDDGDDGLLLAGGLVAAADDVDAGEGAHAVVDSHHALGIVGNQCQSVLYGMEARLAAVGQLVVHVEVILAAQLSPIVLLRLGQHQDDLQLTGILAEALQRPHQHRTTANGQELLRYVAAHAQSLSARHDDDVVHHAIRCLKRMPSAIWSAVGRSAS